MKIMNSNLTPIIILPQYNDARDYAELYKCGDKSLLYFNREFVCELPKTIPVSLGTSLTDGVGHYVNEQLRLYNLIEYYNVFLRKRSFMYELTMEKSSPIDPTYISWVLFKGISDTRNFDLKHYYISSRRLFTEEYTELVDWAENNLTKDSYWSSGGLWGFANDEDASLFMLRWS